MNMIIDEFYCMEYPIKFYSIHFKDTKFFFFFRYISNIKLNIYIITKV